ncbi:MAG: hypothetical protein CMK59_07640 [Proteobacteria bacterium]|nr:hypothetical protein [Pseudomonadota bacterium]
MRLILLTLLTILSNPAWAGGGTYISQSINTVLLIVLLVFLGKTPILNSFSKRSRDIEIDIDEAQKALSEAKSFDSSIQAKLDSLEQQIQSIKTEAQQEALIIKQDLTKQAEAEMIRIKKSADANIEGALQIAKSEIRKEAVATAVDLAEKQLKTQIQKSDQKRLSQEFITGLSPNNEHSASL